MRLPGAAEGSNVQMCDSNGGQRGLDIIFSLGMSGLWERLGSSVNKGFGVAILPDGAHHLEGVLVAASGEPLIINTTNSGHELILITPKVVAVKDQILHWSCRTLRIM